MSRESKVFGQLRELVRIISETGPEDLRVVALSSMKKSRAPYARLFQILRGSDDLTESAAMRSLFSERLRHEPNSERVEDLFRKVKSRLKARLLNTLFVLDLDVGSYSQFSRTLFDVNRSVFFVRVLKVVGAKAFASVIAKKYVVRAMGIEEWSCAMDLLRVLRSDAAQRGDAKGHQRYRDQYDHCLKLLAMEQEAELCIEQLHLAFARSGGEKPAHALIAEGAAKDVSVLSAQYPTFKFAFVELRLRSLATQLKMDYRATIQVCDEALTLLDLYPVFKNRARVGEYAIMGLISAVQIRDATIAQIYIDKCKATLESKDNNWFNFKEFQFLHVMHGLRFPEALDIVTEVIANTRFQMQTEATRDRWGLFRLYAEYVNRLRVPIQTPSDFSLIVPSFSTDKAGFYTSMILLHILLLADRKQFGELRDRIDFIRGYRKRHLKGLENSQSNHFFRMLELIETCDLNYNKIVRKTKPMLDTLTQSELHEPIQGEQLLPYTWIWNRLMEQIREYRPLHARNT